ncbi:MAG: phosphoribosylamine--glycine ligase [Candidatus Thermoplasmatota archaeon]|jgi:phosphoribosylamine--glycine ligase|nr:phosphoribosylamine--glycine ligase [Candidatus Thermoplasmatota archaeon]MCL5984236.1 phosphoribosylamine--glycine ligase [Candidatus Thermoplasmatota archaeon]
MAGMKVLLVGSGGREHAIGEALRRSEAEVFVAAPTVNPGLHRLAREYRTLPVDDGEAITQWAKACRVSLAVLGPDASVAAGVADNLRAAGIPTVGPGKDGARMESSKAFAREFLDRHGIRETPQFQIVKSPGEIEGALSSFAETGFVLKPSWLTAGKGVLVGGVDFQTPTEGRQLASQMLAEGKGAPLVVEEKLDGEEFSLMAFVDGKHVYPMPLVKDYKRALDGDLGGNTGGMGSFSTRDHLLPYVSSADRDTSVALLERTVTALQKEGIDYRGILYAGFMMTRRGPLILEFNARFGDPEALNVLTLYNGTDFAPLLLSLAEGNLNRTFLDFRLRASVVKYLVPPGYGSHPTSGGILEIDEAALARNAISLYYGSVTPGPHPGSVVLGTSRAIALVAEASALREALVRVEDGIRCVKGTFDLRHDIATAIDLKKRTSHMDTVRATTPTTPGGVANLTRSGPQPPSVFT